MFQVGLTGNVLVDVSSSVSFSQVGCMVANRNLSGIATAVTQNACHPTPLDLCIWVGFRVLSLALFSFTQFVFPQPVSLSDWHRNQEGGGKTLKFSVPMPRIDVLNSQADRNTDNPSDSGLHLDVCHQSTGHPSDAGKCRRNSHGPNQQPATAITITSSTACGASVPWKWWRC